MSDNLSGDQFKDFKEYTSHYNKGWTHSTTAKSPNLEKGDDYGIKHGNAAGNAWQDGYLDAAVGREKYALRGHRFGGEKVEGY